jgi:alpha-mannosidase
MCMKMCGGPQRFWMRVAGVAGLLFLGGSVFTGRADFSVTNKTLYVVATAHLDDQWNWTIVKSINSYLPATLKGNFSLFSKYPGYTFSFEESFRYRLAKEYFPADYLTLSNYISQGRWRIAGTSVVAGDVIVTSPESVIRGALYSTDYWRREFGVQPVDLFLPDCFGFPASLPSVAAHCGLKGFSTQKLQVKTPAITIPFQNLGKWIGVDSNAVIASLQPGSYHTTLSGNLGSNATVLAKINNLGTSNGLYLDYMYFGLGDTGGAPDETSVNWLQQSLTNSGGAIRVISSGSDQVFRDLSASDIAKLPSYQGELLMRYHGAGCYTAHSEMKRYHRLNEQRALAAEQASVVADWARGGGTYPKEKLNTAWERFLWHTFHDDLPGTSIDAAYTFSWNDELLALNEFGAVERQGVGVVAKALDTTSQGVPVVVFNALAVQREDVVEASVAFTNSVPSAVRVYGPDGAEVPSQCGAAVGNRLPVCFLAKVPASGCSVYDIRAAAAASTLSTGLSISTSQVENARYRVQLNAAGDVSSVYDKLSQRELLKAPIRWASMYDSSTTYPAWEILYAAVTGSPSYLGGVPTVQILENGPARVSLGVTRFNGSSTFTERIRLAAGDAGNRVDWSVSANWGTRQALMKVVFPLAVTNEFATYDLGLGAIQRSNNTANLYEVPAQQWADLTQPDGSYGVTIMNDCKYGWDKPDSSTLRLTIFHTPDPGSSSYGSYQQNIDLGCHEFSFSLMGHAGDWREAGSCWTAARVNQPLQAFQTVSHAGALGKTFGFLSCANTNVMVKALKKAEKSDEVIVRLQELSGRPQTADLTCAGNITAAREVNGVEDAVGALEPANGSLRVSLGAWRPMTLALTISRGTVVSAPAALPVSLPFNLDAISTDGARADGNFDSGYTYPAELMPTNLVRDEVPFQLGATNDSALNVVACQGQTMALAAGYNRLYLLAASATNDQSGTFAFTGAVSASTNLTVRYFSGFIGQWNPPSLKSDEVGWVCTHRHTPTTNDAYQFCYLFKYCLEVPAGSTSLTLPNAPGMRIFAMTLATNTAAETLVAGGRLGDSGFLWANAGTNQTVSVSTGGTASVTLDGSSSASSGNIASCVWTEAGVTVGTGLRPSLSLAAGSHAILLTIADDQGRTAQDAVLVVVQSGVASGVWSNPAGGEWLTGTNWSGGTAAYGTGYTADFGALSLSSNLVVSLEDVWTIGHLRFDDASGAAHSIALRSDSSSPLTLSVASGSPVLNVAVPATIALPLSGTNGLTKTGDDWLTILGSCSVGSGQTIIDQGGLAFAGDSSFSGSGNFGVSNGVVSIGTSGSVSLANYVTLGGLYSDPTDAGCGVLNQTSGTLNVGGGGQYFEIGAGSGSFGSYNLAGGSANALGSTGMRVGASGIGLLNQSGGTLTCARYLAIGTATGGNSSGGGRGVATFTGGVAALGTAGYRVILGDKPGTQATLNIGTMAGGKAQVYAASSSSGNWGVEFLDTAGSTMSAALNLNSGMLQTAGPIWRNTANNTTGLAWLNFNGGVLQAGASQMNFIANALTAANVYRGGAVIDTQTFQVTNLAVLRAPGGKGIYPAGGLLVVTNGGSGYQAAPMVVVSGGSGSNATAVAEVASGVVTAVEMTCPGERYLPGDILTFTFTGGGSLEAAGPFVYSLRSADLADNATGGLVKLGSGSLTLAAVNTYGGDTVVSNGVLNLSGSLVGGGNVLGAGGTLSGNGGIAGSVTIGAGGTLAPGWAGIGELAISNALSLQPGATAYFKLNKSLASNDSVLVLGQVSYSGRLVVTNLAGTLAAGDRFRLFRGASFSGKLSGIVPSAPGAGLAWDTSQLTVDGSLGVRAVSTGPMSLSFSISGDSLSLSWPSDHTGWRLQMQTNTSSVGLGTNWVDVPDSVNTNRMIFPLYKANTNTFFRLVYPG